MFRFVGFLFGAVVLFSFPARAGVNEWVRCGGTSSISGVVNVGTSECLEFAFTNALTDQEHSFNVTASSVLACLEPDVAGAEATATADVQRCVAGRTRDANSCQKLTDSPLNGTGGSSGTQNRCVRIGRGQYRVVFVDPGSGKTASFTLEAE